MSWSTKTHEERISWLTDTSCDCLKSSLACSGYSLDVLRDALDVVERRGEKTKARHLRSAIRKAERTND